MVKPWMPLLGAYASYARERFIQETRQPMKAQEQFLQELLRVQQETELGQKFGIADIKTIDQFRSQVPILPYSSYEPYTQRIAQGEPNVLNPDPVVYINLTSGTTGKQKMVPVTKRFRRSLGRASLASFGFAFQAFEKHSAQRPPDCKLAFGQLLTTNSARIQGYTPAGIPYGPVTVGSLHMDRAFNRFLVAHPYDILGIADSLSRHYVSLLFSLCEPDLRGMIANFPMLMLRTCQYLEQYAEALIEDIEAGTIADWLKLEPEIRYRLERRWRPNPQRAAVLRHILQQEGTLTPKLAWSKLSLVLTAMGGTSEFYLKRFPDYFGDIPVYGGVYGTAEGNFGAYFDFNMEGCILAIGSGFYEFIPEDQWEEEQPKTLLPVEVKVGERYRILITSYSGFYRYDIGDVVEVLGFYEQTPIIVFRHRRGGLLSSTTEKTTEHHVTQVMRTLQQEFSIALEDFCITLSDNEFPGRYVVNIELAAGQSLPDPDAFLKRFDYWLGEYNNPYATVRIDQVPPPRLQILAPGSFAIVRQRQLKRGTSDSQLKIPHVSEDRRFLEGLQIVKECCFPADLSRVGA